MPVANPPRASAADLVALAAALERDERKPAGEVRERDRRIGAELAGTGDDRPALALAWLERIEREDTDARGLHERVTAALQACGVVVGLLGLALGWLAALAAFYYEGSGRVNVIAVLVVLVGVPLVFLLTFLVAALPRRAIAWLPGATAVSALARGLSPGRMAHLALRFVPRDARAAMAGLRARAGEHQTLYARVQKWLLLRWSQVFAVAFQCGALSATLGLVLFTDLVFGWSTTLASGDPAADAARVHDLTSAIAAPWGWAIKDAVPGVELIRESRYFRVVDAAVSPAQASRLGGWWSFLVLAMLVYGLIPRLIVLAIAARRLARAVDYAVAATPGVPALVRRLQAARIQTSAPGADDRAPRESNGGQGGPARAAPPPGLAIRAIVNWSEVPVDDDVAQQALGRVPVFRAGGASTLAADAGVVAQVADGAAAGREGDVAVIVKAWEPPLLEFIDFAQALRRALGEGRAIVVFPVAADAAGSPRSRAAAHVDVWRRRLGRVGDPWLRVAELDREVT
jgi:hypothetical protein